MDIESRKKLFKGGTFVSPMQRPEIRIPTEERISLRRKEAAMTAQETKRLNQFNKERAISMNPYHRIYVETTSEQSDSKIDKMARKLSGVVSHGTTSTFELTTYPKKSHFFPNTNKNVIQMEFHTDEIDG
ncbi:unnamed protein product, partial [marine sediment metagenome]